MHPSLVTYCGSQKRRWVEFADKPVPNIPKCLSLAGSSLRELVPDILRLRFCEVPIHFTWLGWSTV